MKYEFKNIKVLGYTTDYNKCECCGKENLKGTVSILDLETGVIMHFGTTCAVSADKYDDLNALKKAKSEINQEKKLIADAKQLAYIMARRLKVVNREQMVKDFLKYLEVEENRTRRFNWESYV